MLTFCVCSFHILERSIYVACKCTCFILRLHQTERIDSREWHDGKQFFT